MKRTTLLFTVLGLSTLLFNSCVRCNEELACQDLDSFTPLISSQASQIVNFQDADGRGSTADFASLELESSESGECDKDGYAQCRCTPCEQFAQVNASFDGTPTNAANWRFRIDLSKTEQGIHARATTNILTIDLGNQTFSSWLPLEDNELVTFFESITINDVEIKNVHRIPANGSETDACYYNINSGLMAVESELLEYTIVRTGISINGI